MSNTPTLLAVGLAVPSLLSPGVAQAEEPGKKVGLVFGISHSSITQIGESYFSGGVGLMRPDVGISFQIPMSGSWSIVPEIWYNHFGMGFGTFASLSHDMLSLPLMFRKTSAKHTPIAPFFELGPEVGFRVSTQQSSGFYSYSSTSGAILDLLVVSANFGFGVTFPIANLTGTLSLRGTHAVTPYAMMPGGFNRRVGVNAGLYF